MLILYGISYELLRLLIIPHFLAVKLWGSCRLWVVALCNLGLFFIMYLRFNLSVAIVCMNQPTQSSIVTGPINRTVDNTSSTLNQTHEVGCGSLFLSAKLNLSYCKLRKSTEGAIDLVCTHFLVFLTPPPFHAYLRLTLKVSTQRLDTPFECYFPHKFTKIKAKILSGNPRVPAR